MNPLHLITSIFKPTPHVDVVACVEKLQTGSAVLVDVREPTEWAGGVAARAVLLPLSDLQGTREKWKPFLAAIGDREVALYCAVGGRAGIAAQTLLREGYRAVNAGGLSDWSAAGWPIVPPETAP